jgi:hypothetical protein
VLARDFGSVFVLVTGTVVTNKKSRVFPLEKGGEVVRSEQIGGCSAGYKKYALSTNAPQFLQFSLKIF